MTIAMDRKQTLQHALKDIENIKERCKGKKIIFFLDYDGTLTPIVDKPENAVLSPAMHDCLSQLSQQYPVVIISGRELSNVVQRVDINTIYYSGNHGIEVAGPNFYHINKEINNEFIQLMNTVANQLTKQFQDIKGVLIENKTFSLTIHYRLVEENFVSLIERSIDAAVSQHPNLKKHSGKKVFEIRPKIDWHKGKVVFYLLEQLNLSLDTVMPFYIGDDVTDEDAFHALQDMGITVLVAKEKHGTEATHYLLDTQEVLVFLNHFLQ